MQCDHCNHILSLDVIIIHLVDMYKGCARTHKHNTHTHIHTHTFMFLCTVLRSVAITNIVSSDYITMTSSLQDVPTRRVSVQCVARE